MNQRERIRKLRRLAADPGAFSGEAANATSLADKLEATLDTNTNTAIDWDLVSENIEDDWGGARYTSEPYRERRWPRRDGERPVWHADESGRVVGVSYTTPGFDFASAVRKRSPFG